MRLGISKVLLNRCLPTFGTHKSKTATFAEEEVDERGLGPDIRTLPVISVHLWPNTDAQNIN